jgi:hypothetical protein
MKFDEEIYAISSTFQSQIRHWTSSEWIVAEEDVKSFNPSKLNVDCAKGEKLAPKKHSFNSHAKP